LDPPLRGGPWVALYDPRLIGGHRTAIYALGGHARIAARFAIDFVRLSPEGARARGDASQIANWYGFGEDVLAVADAVVADAKQDLEEWPTLDSRTRVPLENVSGNFICLDLGDGRFAFYEHLKMGSLHVKPGDRVTRGQVFASLGNTGSSSAGPHRRRPRVRAAASCRPPMWWCISHSGSLGGWIQQTESAFVDV
jgi:hypothetical protein